MAYRLNYKEKFLDLIFKNVPCHDYVTLFVGYHRGQYWDLYFLVYTFNV